MIVTLEVEVERVTGPFRSRDQIGEELAEMVDGTVYVDDSEYEVVNVDVLAPTKAKRR
jgi:hypothetical protein